MGGFFFFLISFDSYTINTSHCKWRIWGPGSSSGISVSLGLRLIPCLFLLTWLAPLHFPLFFFFLFLVTLYMYPLLFFKKIFKMEISKKKDYSEYLCTLQFLTFFKLTSPCFLCLVNMHPYCWTISKYVTDIIKLQNTLSIAPKMFIKSRIQLRITYCI